MQLLFVVLLLIRAEELQQFNYNYSKSRAEEIQRMDKSDDVM